MTSNNAKSYPTTNSGSIRSIALSPAASDGDKEAFALIVDESNRVTISRVAVNTDDEHQNHNNQLQISKSFPLAGSPRAAVWCPFVTTNATETNSNVHCLVTSCVGCPVQLRYFSEQQKSAGNSNDEEDQSHDPAWVEGTYKCYDDLDYLIAANALCWHKSRKGQIVCGFDKGYLGIFDVERPGRDLTWRHQVNSLAAFQNCTSHNRKITNPQHAVSAVAVHDTRPDLIACGTRSGFMPIFDCRMKLPACILKCSENENNNINNFGHAPNSGITEIKFDPNSEYFVYSTSRGKGRKVCCNDGGNQNNYYFENGVVQHDLRKPQIASGMMITRRISAVDNNSNIDDHASSTMQPIHFDLVSSSEYQRIYSKLYGNNNIQDDAAITANSRSPSSYIISGNPLDSSPILGTAQNNNNRSATSSSQQQKNSSSSTPLTAISICTKRGIMVLGGGRRNFAEPDENGEDMGKMEIGKIRARDLPHQASSNFIRTVKF